MFENEYQELLTTMQRTFDTRAKDGVLVALETSSEDPFAAYLGGFSASDARQYHNCSACKEFFRNFYNAGILYPNGAALPAFLPLPEQVPQHYRAAFRNVLSTLDVAGDGMYRVKGYAIAYKPMWGHPTKGGWTHFHVVPPKSVRGTKNRAAQLVHNHDNVHRFIHTTSRKVMEEAVKILRQDIYRSDNVLPGAEWLLELYNKSYFQFMHAIGTAPNGFCHPASGMIGTLIDDLNNGYSPDDAAKRFEHKMHPLRYRRPTAAPKLGTINAAEKKFAELGLAPALKRVPFTETYLPNAQWSLGAVNAGLFKHLRGARASTTTAVLSRAKRMGWLQFQREFLAATPSRLQLVISDDMPFCTFLTAKDPQAPLLFKWNHPVSWYHWAVQTKDPSMYNTREGAVHDVLSIAEPYDQTRGLLMLVDGLTDVNVERASLALFPEFLRTELHEVRSVIEAHSRSTTVPAPPTGVAGIHVNATNWHPFTVIVDEKAPITIDRYE